MNCYCNIEIVIDNPVLLEILQKYKDLGLFLSSNTGYGIGSYSKSDKELNETINNNEIRAETTTPAFFLRVSAESIWDLDPALFDKDKMILDQVLERVIIPAMYSFPDEVYYDDLCDIVVDIDQSLFNQLENELIRRKDEINQAYAYVYLLNWQSWNPPEFREEYEYDPIQGEYYSYDEPPKYYL